MKSKISNSLAGESSPSASQAATTETTSEVVHAEPQRGGSYTRNLDTGELVPANPDPDQPAE